MWREVALTKIYVKYVCEKALLLTIALCSE